MHRLLARQLRRHVTGAVPEELTPLLRAVSEAYRAAEEDRRLVERSLELASDELLSRNAHLRDDIALRRAAEDALVASEGRLRAVLRALPDALFLLSRDGTTVEELSEPADETRGPASHGTRALAEVVARSAPARIGRAFETREVQTWNAPVETGGRSRHVELRLVVAGDDVAIAIVRDVTETQDLQARLLVADRMAAVGTLAAGVAHEINNPLTYVLANLRHVQEELERLEDDGHLSVRSDAQDALAAAWDGVRRVRRIVQDLKTYSHSDASEQGSADVTEVLEAALSMATPELKHRARVHRRIDAVPRVAGSASRLVQVFLNLLVNAAQALPDGAAGDHTITVCAGVEHDRVVVRVSDTGPGIPVDVRGRLFDPFFTTKPVGVGTGLGLWICRNVVEHVGGAIDVEQTGVGGTTFRVELRPTVSAATSSLSPAVAPGRFGPRRRVLVIDDEPEIGRALRRILSGHDVRVARSADEARAAIAGSSYDRVLCDLMMPGTSGVDLHAELAAARPDIAETVVFITGAVTTDAARRALEATGRPVLEKPFDVDVVRALVAGGQ